jgi:hypothetical protein
VLILAVIGCGGGGTSPQDLTLADVAGTWQGTIAQGYPIGFTISVQGLTHATLQYDLSGTVCGYSAQANVTFDQPLPVTLPDFDLGGRGRSPIRLRAGTLSWPIVRSDPRQERRPSRTSR